MTNVLLLCIEYGEMHLHCLIQRNFTCNPKHLHYIALNLGFSLQSLLCNPSDLKIVNPLISSIFSSLTLFNEWKWHQPLSPALCWHISHTSHKLVIWSKFHQGFWLLYWTFVWSFQCLQELRGLHFQVIHKQTNRLPIMYQPNLDALNLPSALNDYYL